MSQAILHPLNLPLGTEQRKKTTTTINLVVGTLLMMGGLYGLFIPSLIGLLIFSAGALLSYHWYTANARASFNTCWIYGLVFAGLAIAGMNTLHGIVAVVLLVGAYDWHNTHLRKIF